MCTPNVMCFWSEQSACAWPPLPPPYVILCGKGGHFEKLSFGYDFFWVWGDAWRWLCRHVCQKKIRWCRLSRSRGFLSPLPGDNFSINLDEVKSISSSFSLSSNDLIVFNNVYNGLLFIIFFLTFLKVKVRFQFPVVFKNIVAFVEKSLLLNILWPTISKFIPQQRLDFNFRWLLKILLHL